MGRTRPLAIEIVRDNLTFVEALIDRDRQRLDYCAEVGKDVIRAERASDLIRKVREELRHGLGLSWARSIIVERPGPARFISRAVSKEGIFACAGLGLVRGEVATRRDGRLLFRGWPSDEIDEDLPDGINPPDLRIVSALPRQVIVRPYTEAAWRALCATALGLMRAAEAAATAEDLEAIRKALDLKLLMKEAIAQAAPPKLPKD